MFRLVAPGLSDLVLRRGNGTLRLSMAKIALSYQIFFFFHVAICKTPGTVVICVKHRRYCRLIDFFGLTYSIIFSCSMFVIANYSTIVKKPKQRHFYIFTFHQLSHPTNTNSPFHLLFTCLNQLNCDRQSAPQCKQYLFFFSFWNALEYRGMPN